MSKMSEMAATIEELRAAATAINEAANWLAQQFSDTNEAPVEEAKAPEKPALTLEQVRAVLAEKSRAGHTAAIRALLQKYWYCQYLFTLFSQGCLSYATPCKEA